MNRQRVLGFLATATFAAATPAAVTVYTDRAAFEAAIGPHVTYTFDTTDGFPVAPAEVSTVGTIRVYSTLPDNDAHLRSWPAGTGNQTLSAEWGPVLTAALMLAFNAPQTAFGMDMYTDGIDGQLLVHLAGEPSQFVGVPRSETDLLTPSFIGLVSDVGITGYEVRNAGDSRGQRYKGIDNLTVVPEPTPLAGLLGSVVLSLRSRRTIRGTA